ncbi:MAG: DUF3471 domain-containing protein [Fibrobacterales bacterium]
MYQILITLLFCIFSFTSCDGKISNPNSDNIKPILDVNGYSSIQSGRFTKLANIQNPKIALVWQEMDGAKISRYPIEIISNVSPAAPFSFSSKLLENPPLYMNDYHNIFVGNFYLYSDNNKNQTLDMLVHPDYEPYIDSLSKLKQDFIHEKQKLLELSNINKPTPSGERYYITNESKLLFHTETGIDSSWFKSPLFKGIEPGKISHRRQQLLQCLNKWESFLGSRANMVSVQTDTLHHKQHNLQLTQKYLRKLFAKPDNDSLFQSQLKTTTKAALDYYSLIIWVRNSRISTQKNEYIYTPAYSNDWIAGMSIWNYVFYLYDENDLNEIISINQYVTSIGKTLISNPQDLSIGYNVLECNIEYNCKILSSLDSVKIELGDEACYIEGCQRDLEVLSSRTKIQLPDSLLQMYQGHYKTPDSTNQLHVTFSHGSLWVKNNQNNVFKISAATKTIFFNSIYNTEIEFVIDSTSNSLISHNNNSFIQMQKFTSPFDSLNIDSIISSILFPKTVEIKPLTLEQYSGLYVLSKTSNLTIVPDNDHLIVSFPGIGFYKMYPISQDTFVHKESLLQIVFHKNEKGTITELSYESSHQNFIAPAYEYSPRNASYFNYDLNQFTPIVTSGHGSQLIVSDILEDSYNCLTDLAAISSKDNGLSSLTPYTPSYYYFGQQLNPLIFEISDSLSQINLSIHACPNQATDSTQLRLSITGGNSIGSLNTFIQDPHTVTFHKEGTTISINPIQIPKKLPYFIQVIFSPLYSTEAEIVIDSYQVQGY